LSPYISYQNCVRLLVTCIALRISNVVTVVIIKELGIIFKP
jgi:hypothetical protein